MELDISKRGSSTSSLEPTLVDEFLNMVLCKHYFGRKRSFINLWRTKKFQLFNYYILEELYISQKLRHVKAIRKVPKKIVDNINRLNALRNVLAHSFFPENLKRAKPVYKGKNIFTLEALKVLGVDVEEMFSYFMGVEDQF
jgi:hypothetical protein